MKSVFAIALAVRDAIQPGFRVLFQGASSLNLDGKGRLSVPTRHRDVLLANSGGQLTVTRHPHGCLMIFPRLAWEQFRERIATMPIQNQWLKRLFLGNAMDVDMDATGRVLISPELRAAATIGREVLLLGMGSHFELWDKATHDAKEAEDIRAGLAAGALQDLSF